MISSVSGILSSNGINIEDMRSKSKNDYAYAILDVTGEITNESINKIHQIDGIIKTRIII